MRDSAENPITGLFPTTLLCGIQQDKGQKYVFLQSVTYFVRRNNVTISSNFEKFYVNIPLWDMLNY